MNIAFYDSKHVFWLFSVLNHNGYDLEGNPEMHPIRIFVREQMQMLGLPQEEYFRKALPGWPRVGWLSCTLFCLDEELKWNTDPSPVWDEVAWETPEPLDESARAWLRELPAKLAEWSRLPEVEELWQLYQAKIAETEQPGLRDTMRKNIEARLSGTPFATDRQIRIIPNYLQTDWTTDPVHTDEALYVLTGPLKPTAGGVIHELLHEYFAPFFLEARGSLGRFIEVLRPQEAALRQWGYWNPDPDKTVYKVAQECCVRASYELLHGRDIDPDWSTYGLDLANQVYRHFNDHGYFRDSDELLRFLVGQGDV